MKPSLRVVAIAALGLVLSACGSSDDNVSSTAATGNVATTENVVTTTSSSTNASSPADTSSPDDGAGVLATVPGMPTENATLPPDLPAEVQEAFAPVNVTGGVLPIFTDPESDLAIGLTAPVLEGTDIEGQTVLVDAAKQGPTIVLFVAHWCPHCNAEIPVVKSLGDDGVLDDVNVVAVATGSRPDGEHYPPQDWLRSLDWTYGSLLDGVFVNPEAPEAEQLQLTAMSAYGGAGFPYAVLLNSDGTVARRWSGERSADEWRTAIEALK